MNSLAKTFGVHSVQVRTWKKELVDRAEELFQGKKRGEDFKEKEANLLEEIGRLTVENNWLKKKLGV